MTTIQPKPSTSTPITSFLKLKSSTSTPLSSKKTKPKQTPLPKETQQRKRSTSIFSNASKESFTELPFNRKLVLSIKSLKKQEPSTEDRKASLYTKKSFSSIGSLSESESSTHTLADSGEYLTDSFVNPLSATPEEDDSPKSKQSMNSALNMISLHTSLDQSKPPDIIFTSENTILPKKKENLKKSKPKKEDERSKREDERVKKELEKTKKELEKTRKELEKLRREEEKARKEEEKVKREDERLKRDQKRDQARKDEKLEERPKSLLRRTRSRKWSNSSIVSAEYVPPVPELPVCKIDPTTFLAGPGASIPSLGTHCMYKNHKFTLMNRLLESMMYGGHITSHLHIPMDLWYQPSVRLPYIEAKIAASELLIAVLEKMSSRKLLDINPCVKSDLRVLSQTLSQINDTLMRKLGCHSDLSKRHDSLVSNRQSTNRTSQAIVAWSSKLSKIRFDSTRSAVPNDEQNQLYIKTLIKLFTDVKILETWDSKLSSLSEKDGKKESLVNEAYTNNSICISQFVTIVCGFVMKDYDILLDKWFKRSSLWMTE